MTKLKVTIEKNIDIVWDHIANIESHVTWMQDARTIELTSGTANTVGALYKCDTKIGPLRTIDRFEIIKYDRPNFMEIFHIGTVDGTGYFKLEKIDENKTVFIWEEELKFPWYMGASIGKKIAMKLLHSIWRKNLQRLKAEIEQ